MAAPAPQVSAAGITAGDFSAWYDWLKSQYQAIFGIDVYIEEDSQDGQLIAVLARAFNDCGAAAVGVYNSFSPATAQGAGLSSVVKINGLTRDSPGNSTALLTLVGQANITITNGQAKDGAGNLWNLPPSVTIPNSGTIDVIATCATEGAVNAGIGTINQIQTAVYGWQTVTNAAAATSGSPVQSDASLRQLQSVSTALPSQGIFEGIEAAVLNVTGVTRARGYENNTGSTDANGIAAKSLAFFVEGGAQADVINAIAKKIPPGIPTLGSVSATYTTPKGSTRLLRYSPPTNATITVALTIKAIGGWTVDAEPVIQQAMVDYIMSLPMGDNINYMHAIIPAHILDSQYAGTFKVTAMTLKKNAGSAAAADVAIAYNEAPISDVAHVLITVT